MHSVGLREQAIQVARRLGYDIRQDWLGGEGSGHCLVRGRKILLLDLAQSPEGQFSAIRDALHGEIQLANVTMTEQLADWLDVRSVA